MRYVILFEVKAWLLSSFQILIVFVPYLLLFRWLQYYALGLKNVNVSNTIFVDEFRKIHNDELHNSLPSSSKTVKLRKI